MTFAQTSAGTFLSQTTIDLVETFSLVEMVDLDLKG
jgi:hypothetical protein